MLPFSKEERVIAMNDVLRLWKQTGVALGTAILTCALSLAVQFGCAVLSKDTSLNIFIRPTYQLMLWTLVTLATMVLVWRVFGEEWAAIVTVVALVAAVVNVVKHYGVAVYLFDDTTVANTVSQIIYTILVVLWSVWVAFVFNRNKEALIDP